ncbi:DUF3817 domain-containing protein [Parasphingorhabdus pacifica]
MPRTYAGWFRLVAVAEALSWIGLLIAMVFKYGFDMPLAVTIFGSIHGGVFVVYVLACLALFWPLRWSLSVLALALISSVPPLGSVVFDVWANRRGHMSRDSVEPSVAEQVAGTRG